jgi:hypothetical protein
MFVMRSLRTLRYFQSTLELLADRGHTVQLFLDRGGHGEAEEEWLQSMLARPNFASYTSRNPKSDKWHRRGMALRAGLEYIQFLDPKFSGRPRYLFKALRRHPPEWIRRLADFPPLRTRRGRRALYAVVDVLERAMPRPTAPGESIAQFKPDVVVLGDDLNRSSLRDTFLLAARKHGIPTVMCLASWDNLTTRPRLRAFADRMLVWNDVQRDEAVQLHGVRADQIVITGAANFDQWFDWQPRPAAEFLAATGLDPERPYILWVGSALNNWEPAEALFFREWLTALRSSSDPLIREVDVMVRPHPLRLTQWDEFDFDEFANVLRWPPSQLDMPVGSSQKAEYYDSIHHSKAVVGINTSAMIETAIIGRPVFSVLAAPHADSQRGSLHFLYLLEQGGGVLNLAETFEEHLADLGAALRSPDAAATSARDFIGSFVRPNGIDRPATPLVVAEIEKAVALSPEPANEPAWVVPLRTAIRLAIWARSFAVRVRHLDAAVRAARKAQRRRSKAWRQRLKAISVRLRRLRPAELRRSARRRRREKRSSARREA